MGVARLRSGGTLRGVTTRHESGIVLSEFKLASAPQPQPPREKLPEPTALEMAGHAGEAFGKWIAAGVPVAPPEVRAMRHSICKGCQYWDPSGWIGFGKCRHQKCGCSRFKHAFATERCPDGKWEALPR